MKLKTCVGYLAMLVAASSSALAQVGDGYIGVYSDTLGTSPCTNVPPYTGATLYVLAKTAGESVNGVTGVEFRIEVTDPNGWLISYAPPPSASIAMGNPVDTDPAPNQGGGVHVSFPVCQNPTANGIVRLGTLSVFNVNGYPTQLLVKRHSMPSNAGFACPLFVLCDSPTYSKVCMSSAAPDTCSLQPQKQRLASPGDEPIFAATVNQLGQGSVPGGSDSLSAAARAIREQAIEHGLPEAYLSWHTPEEGTALKRTMPMWTRKISDKILDRSRLLKERNVLVQGRRHLASQYSEDLVPVDSLARLKVQLKVTNTSPFDAQFFQSIGGSLVASAPRYGWITAWVPPEQLQTLAERNDVNSIMHLAAVGTNTITSEGDAAHGAAQLRNWSHLSGAGQTVGVISDGAVHWEESRNRLELPASITTNQNLGLGTGDEGTAMLEIVHDLAPDANLAFAPSGQSIAEMTVAVDFLRSAGAGVIVDDVTFSQEQLFQEDSEAPIALARKEAIFGGVFYVANAGNVARQHYEGYATGGTACYSLCQNEYQRPHNFGGGDQLLQITVGAGNHRIMLQWSDRWPDSGNDFDLYLLYEGGCPTGIQSTFFQDGEGSNNYAVELLSFPVGSPGLPPGKYNILIDYWNFEYSCQNPPFNIWLDLRSLGRRNLVWDEHLVSSGSIDANGRLSEVYTVGAVAATNPSQVLDYSSRGPVKIFHPFQQTRTKPDAVGATNVSISGVGPFGNPVVPGGCPANAQNQCRFDGTSAAAPHVAAIAALLREGCPGLTPAEIARALNCAAPIHPPNDNAGHGFIDAQRILACGCPNPAAQVFDFKVIDEVAQWRVGTEYQTAGYILEGSQSAAGPWTQIGPMELPGSADYSVDISGSGFELVRLVELETTENRIIYGMDTSQSAPPAEPEPPSSQWFAARLDSLEEAWQQSNLAAESNGQKYVIFTPGQFLQDVQTYVAHYWQSRHGYVPVVINTDSYPQPPDHEGFRQALKTVLASQAASGAKYFHLIGDWNDWREASDPAVYPSLWVSSWAALRQDYVTDYPPQPSKDVIPAWVVPDGLPRGRNMAFGVPYWITDADYADVDEDSVPDVVVTRWPVTDQGGLLGLTAKMWQYNSAPEGQRPFVVSLYVHDVDFHEGSGDGTLAANVADGVAAAIGSGPHVLRINRSDSPGRSTWWSIAKQNWKMSLPEVIFSAASGSDQYYPGYLYFNWADLVGATTPLFVGASCATASFAASENPDLGIPLSERLLTSGVSGPIAWVGPTAGTWQDGNEEVAQRIATELFANTSRPMAESWLKAIQGVVDDNAGGPRERIAETARSYVFLGDPLSRLRHFSGTPTEAAGDWNRAPSLALVQNTPNPFNPTTRIAFATTRHGPVSLRIYDIRGQLVRTLIESEVEPGRHQVEWRGDDANGNRMSSGVYLCRLVAEGASLTRKLAMVK